MHVVYHYHIIIIVIIIIIFYYYTLSLSLTYCNWPYTPILHSFPWGTQSRVSDSVNITTLELSIHPVCFSKHIHPSPS